MSKIKLLIITTWDTKCGIASFSAALKSQLEKNFMVDIAPLDQDILKNYPSQMGDNEIRKIIQLAKDYDVVNFQLEWGILGTGSNIIRRFDMLMQGFDKILLTMHTPIYCKLNFRKIINLLLKGKIVNAFSDFCCCLILYYYEKRKLIVLKKTTRRLKDKLQIIVHTKREQKNLSGVYQVPNVHAHPLSNIHDKWPVHLQNDADAYRTKLLERFGNDAVLIGFYGFISKYKGLETAIEAIKLLPTCYKLLIFGSIHPQSIVQHERINPYLGIILDALAYTPFKRTTKKSDDVQMSSVFPDSPARSAGVRNEQESKNFAVSDSRKGQIFFMGSPDDYEFAKAISAVDACVFPYLEVGQSASGPVSIAIELQRPTFLTCTHTFFELEKYFPNNFTMFDIGNSVQLSQYLMRLSEYKYVDIPAYNKETQKEIYTQVLKKLANEG